MGCHEAILPKYTMYVQHMVIRPKLSSVHLEFFREVTVYAVVREFYHSYVSSSLYIRARHCDQYGCICDLTFNYLSVFATRKTRVVSNLRLGFKGKNHCLRMKDNLNRCNKTNPRSLIANWIAMFEYSKAHYNSNKLYIVCKVISLFFFTICKYVYRL